MPVLKNSRWEVFAQEMAKPGMDPKLALKKAGYAPHSPNASRLIKIDIISARISEIAGRGAERAAASVERIVQELERIAFSDITEVISIKRGRFYVTDTAKISPEVRAAISGVKKTKDGVEVRFYDKAKALEMLARHKGMYRENIDLRVSVSLVDLVLASYPQPEEPKVIEHDPDEKPDT